MVGCVVRARTTSTAGAPRGRATQDTAAPDAPLRGILVGCCAIDSARSDMIRQLRIRSLCVARAGPGKRKGPGRALCFYFPFIRNAKTRNTRSDYESTTRVRRSRRPCAIDTVRGRAAHRARPRKRCTARGPPARRRRRRVQPVHRGHITRYRPAPYQHQPAHPGGQLHDQAAQSSECRIEAPSFQPLSRVRGLALAPPAPPTTGFHVHGS